VWEGLPRPDLPLVVGLVGGYVHSSEQRSRRDGWFEVIAGKSMPDQGPAKAFGSVQTYDAKPKRRLFEVLASQGMQANQAVTFITDGGEDVRDLPLYLDPNAEHLLDWSHVTMRITVMANMAKGLRSPPADDDLVGSPSTDLAASVGKELGRLKWLLWHGNVFRAVQVTGDLIMDLDVDVADADIPCPSASFSRLSTSSTPTSGPTPGQSPTTASVTEPASPSPARSWSRPSTRW
jgi:hypothetical protein